MPAASEAPAATEGPAAREAARPRIVDPGRPEGWPEPEVSDAEFAEAMRALAPFERAPQLAVAVSGGADSMALALLAERWARARGGSVKAFIVDHRLRPESTAEAAAVRAWLEARGIPADILTWEVAKPGAGIEAAAREGRYALLEAAAAAEARLHLLLGHHRDDQAETRAMRAERGSGAHGRAGMSALRERPMLRLLRPLLGIAKGRLEATLRGFAQPWMLDPSNRDRRFWRARFRLEGRLEGGAATAGANVDADAPARRRELERSLAGFLARHARPHPLGFVRIDRKAALELAADERGEVLRALTLTLGGGRYPPRTARLARLASALDRVTGASLGGALVRAGRDSFTILREPGAIKDDQPLPRRIRVCWDRRFAVRDQGRGSPLRLRPVRRDDVPRIPRELRERLRRRRVPAEVLRTLPLVEAEGRTVAVGPFVLDAVAEGLEVAFRPCYPLTSMGFEVPQVASTFF